MSDVLAPLASIKAPDIAEASISANAFLAMARSWEVADQDSYDLAASELRAVKTRYKDLETKRQELTVPLNQVLKGINSLFKPPMEVLEEVERIIKGKMIGYSDKVERERIEAERRAAEAARMAEEEAKILAKDIGLEQDTAEVAVLAAAAAPVAPIVAKAEGISKVRVTVKARVTDKAALIAAVATRPDLIDILTVNESALNALAKALGHNLKIAGVETYDDKTISARTR